MSIRRTRYSRIMGTRWESGALKRLVLALRLQRRRLTPAPVVVDSVCKVLPFVPRADMPQPSLRRFLRPSRLLARTAATAVLAVGLGAGFAACDSGGGEEKNDVGTPDVTADVTSDSSHDSMEADLVLPDVKDLLSPELPSADLGADLSGDPDVVPGDTVAPDTEPEDLLPDEGEPEDLALDQVEPDVLPDVEPGKECYLDTECPDGQECVGAIYCPPGVMCVLPNSPGECQPIETPEGCKSDADCPPGEVCDLPQCPPGMFCVLPPEPPTGTCVAGERECQTSADCPDGWDCVGAITCPDGAMCILPSKPGVCEPPALDCYSDADCPQGYDCLGASTCPPGAFCILPSGPGECVELPAPAPQPASVPIPGQASDSAGASGVWEALLKRSAERFGKN